MSSENPTAHIYQSLFANLAIAAAKYVAAFLTGSGAMLAEAIHTTADCSNQGLLLLGVKRAAKPADATHPLGYGRALYFWSFMVALLLFSVGGAFSVYEGIHKILHPDPVENVGVGLGVLAFSLVLEGGATLSNVRDLGKRRGATPFFRYLRETKDSDLIVIFGENAAASLGLLVAMTCLGLAKITGEPRWDGVGSALVGVVLLGVAVFLAIEVKSLLLGESADAGIEEALREAAAEVAGVEAVLRVITLQQGPGEVLVAWKARMRDGLTGDEVVRSLNDVERRLRARRPEVRWSFAEPDVEA